jgi:hypothetical protein
LVRSQRQRLRPAEAHHAVHLLLRGGQLAAHLLVHLLQLLGLRQQRLLQLLHALLSQLQLLCLRLQLLLLLLQPGQLLVQVSLHGGLQASGVGRQVVCGALAHAVRCGQLLMQPGAAGADSALLLLELLSPPEEARLGVRLRCLLHICVLLFLPLLLLLLQMQMQLLVLHGRDRGAQEVWQGANGSCGRLAGQLRVLWGEQIEQLLRQAPGLVDLHLLLLYACCPLLQAAAALGERDPPAWSKSAAVSITPEARRRYIPLHPASAGIVAIRVPPTWRPAPAAAPPTRSSAYLVLPPCRVPRKLLASAQETRPSHHRRRTPCVAALPVYAWTASCRCSWFKQLQGAEGDSWGRGIGACFC